MYKNFQLNLKKSNWLYPMLVAGVVGNKLSRTCSETEQSVIQTPGGSALCDRVSDWDLYRVGWRIAKSDNLF